MHATPLLPLIDAPVLPLIHRLPHPFSPSPPPPPLARTRRIFDATPRRANYTETTPASASITTAGVEVKGRRRARVLRAAHARTSFVGRRFDYANDPSFHPNPSPRGQSTSLPHNRSIIGDIQSFAIFVCTNSSGISLPHFLAFNTTYWVHVKISFVKWDASSSLKSHRITRSCQDNNTLIPHSFKENSPYLIEWNLVQNNVYSFQQIKNIDSISAKHFLT